VALAMSKIRRARTILQTGPLLAKYQKKSHIPCNYKRDTSNAAPKIPIIRFPKTKELSREIRIVWIDNALEPSIGSLLRDAVAFWPDRTDGLGAGFSNPSHHDRN